jgi:hypothetical protein
MQRLLMAVFFLIIFMLWNTPIASVQFMDGNEMGNSERRT